FAHFFIQPHGHARHLHPFPTRRSSDLQPYRHSKITITTIYQQRIDYHLPTTNYQLSTITYQLPTTNYQLSTINYQSATTHHPTRSEEHTSELQSRENLVCRLLLEKKNT